VGDRKYRRGLGWVRWGTMLTVFCHSILTPGFGAERIFLNYSLFGRSVSIRALEVFAHEGKLTGELVSYSRFIKPQQLSQLRGGLLQKIEFSPIALSQFLYSSTGQIILGRGSQVIQTASGRGSFYALRSALILAASDPEGFTPLSVLRHYPNPEILVDVEQIIGIAKESNLLFKKTSEFVSESQSAGGVKPLATEDVQRLKQWERAGSLQWQKTTLDLQDSSEKRLRYTRHSRRVLADIYVPQIDQPRPVVVISHGLNSDRQSYGYIAEHLASYGFVVVVPEHPGSNKQQIQSLLAGRGGDVAEPMEFVDRPLDVQFLLDTLQGLVQSDPRFQGKLNLDQVGVMGQSFGGYTSLALAGAPLNIPLLRQSCGQQLSKTLNISLVLQCQALSVPAEPYPLSDPRIKAAIAINPITSAVFGPTSLAQIQIPTMVVTGSDDVIAPALLEQIQPFAALTASQRYLVMIQNSNHFSTIASVQEQSDTVPQIKGLEGPSPEVAQTYLKVLSLVFMQTYINGQQADQRYLSPAGTAVLTQSVLPLSIVQTLPAKSAP
jgi:predicted dienelactone hydrolase